MHVTSALVQLEPGFYILRHPGPAEPPLSLARSPNSSGEMAVLSTRPSHGMILENGSDCIAIHITGGPVELLVAAFPKNGTAAIPTLRVDRIALEAQKPSAPVNAAEAPRKLVIKDKGVSIVGHVELAGDVVASENEILGDPSANRRVEGFQVMWPDKPEGVDIAYSVSVEGHGALPIVKSGNFTGTRREARRITEATFALIGPNAQKYQLTGTAYFSGGFQVPVSSGMPLSGPSGLEHLSGISLRVVPAPAKSAKTASVWEESPKTKVFSAKKTTAAKTAAVKKAAPAVKKNGTAKRK